MDVRCDCSDLGYLWGADMSARIHETEATLTVAGITSPMSLTVDYILLPGFPGTREQPEEKRSVEISLVGGMLPRSPRHKKG